MIPNEPNDATRASGFPQFPGEEVLSHAAALFLEKAEARLASLGLLAVAEGMLQTYGYWLATARGLQA